MAKSLPIGLGNKQRPTQVLLNLVDNEIKFMDTGKVRVTAKAVNGRFNVSVTDTGTRHPRRASNPHLRAVPSGRQLQHQGQGRNRSGLAIAKQIVEMHGGRIWIESTLGKGSTRQIELPARAELRKSAA